MAFSLSLRKIGLIAATAVTLGVGAMASATTASAWPYGGGYGPRHYWGPRPGPGFYGGPAYGYGAGPYYGPRCVRRARMVPGPWGWHRVVRRVCY